MRFNFFGGAGSGKSTAAAWMFSYMKEEGFNVELVLEYIKTWAYLDRNVKSFDQVYILAKQLHAEDRFLYSGVKNLVTDCPISLSAIYAAYHKNSDSIVQPLKILAEHFEKEFPAVNVFLQRKNKPYKKEGRYQTKEEAMAIDSFIFTYLFENAVPNFHIIDHNDREALKSLVDKYADK